MSDFEDKKYDEYGNPLPDNDKNKESEAKEEGETERPEAKSDEQPAEQPEERRYGYYSTDSRDGYSNRGYGNEPKAKKKSKKGVFLSNKGLAALICFCLVFSVLIGICANAISRRVAPSEDTTGGNVQTTAPVATAPVETTAPSGTQIHPAVQITDFKSVPEMAFSETPSRELSTKEICEKCPDSVVIIEVITATSSGAGSGVIYSKDGYIVTNYHVASEDCTSITVTLNNGEKYNATYVFGDSGSDIAVIKIDKNDCKPAEVANSADIVMGESVIAIGNPLGLGIAATDGIISAVERTVTIDYTSMVLLQTSAAINQGNSGGGLFNAYGQLIGIVNAKVGGTLIEGTGYAIPSSSVLRAVNDIKNYGYVTGKARLGISYSTQYESYFNFIYISEISENGSAAAAGIKVGDIIDTVNGQTINSSEVLTQMLTKYKVGDTVTLTVLRPEGNITDYITQSWFGVSLDRAYLKNCEEFEVTVKFVEFNPNAK